MEARKQAIERDKERMTLDRDRFALDKARAERDAEMGELTKQQTQLQIAAAKREEEYELDKRAIIPKFQEMVAGGYEAEEIAPDGTSLGIRRFQDGPKAVAEAKARGNMFKPGSLRQVPPKDSTERMLIFRDLTNELLIKHGKMTLEAANAARQQDQELESEGILEAGRYYLMSDDVAGTKDRIYKASKGRFKIGDDVMLKKVPDELTGSVNIVGTRMVNCKEQQVFDYMMDMVFPTMGAKTYADYKAKLTLEGQKQKAETLRADKKNTADLQRTNIEQRGAMDREVYRATKDLQVAAMKGKDDEDPIAKGLWKIMSPLVEKMASNPQFQADPQKFNASFLEQFNYAYKLRKSGNAKNDAEAAAIAAQKMPLIGSQ
jgi:hypothetical protein